MHQLPGFSMHFMTLSFAKTGEESAMTATEAAAYKHFLITSSNANVTAVTLPRSPFLAVAGRMNGVWLSGFASVESFRSDVLFHPPNLLR
jgi:hypothetical protein